MFRTLPLNTTDLCHRGRSNDHRAHSSAYPLVEHNPSEDTTDSPTHSLSHAWHACKQHLQPVLQPDAEASGRKTKRMKPSAAWAWSACIGTRCSQHPEGALEQLEDLLLGEDSGLDLGLDALDHPAPAAGLLTARWTRLYRVDAECSSNLSISQGRSLSLSKGQDPTATANWIQPQLTL